MATRETLEHVVRTRTLTADAVFGNHVDLRAYPYRLLSILSHRGIGAEQVTRAVAAAEALESLGWELVTVSEFASSRMVYAIMRRR
ncbi:transcriptional regulator [Micromonospora sp. KLBMP9576]|uniref:transcriptional regulator n=1 Tax=Micromonospora sp. KLBMP9576 TaxID=3424769 RepID=UPI003D8F7A41